MTYTGHMGIKSDTAGPGAAVWPRSLSLNEHTLNSVVCKISCESMGLAKKPTHANNKSHREIRVSPPTNLLTKARAPRAFFPWDGPPETPLNHMPIEVLWKPNIGFPRDIPMGSVLLRSERDSIYFYITPSSLLLFSRSRPGPSTSRILSEVFFNIFISSSTVFKSLEFLHMVFVSCQRVCEYVYKHLFSCLCLTVVAAHGNLMTSCGILHCCR